eukprot:4839988-Ditylum_brightwellii.AAC.1
MRGHIGMTMSMGEGSVFSSSTKHNLNTKRSTKTELIAADDAMQHTLWISYFLKFQVDRIVKGGVEMKHCVAEEMFADYFIKLFQGHPFCKFRKAILNLKPYPNKRSFVIHPPQERIGLSQNARKVPSHIVVRI